MQQFVSQAHDTTEQNLSLQYSEIQANVNRMAEKSHAMKRIHEINKEQKELDIQQKKLALLDASSAVVTSSSKPTRNQQRDKNRSVELSNRIDEVRSQLSAEAAQLRESIETNEIKSKQSRQSSAEQQNLNMSHMDLSDANNTLKERARFNQSAEQIIINPLAETQDQHMRMSAERNTHKQNTSHNTQQNSQHTRQTQQSKSQQPPKKQMTFRLAKPDPEVFPSFIDDIQFGGDRKRAVMKPIPFGVGQMKFTIERDKGGLNKMHPAFNLYYEKPYGNRVLILYGKKRAFNKTANYLISLSRNKGSRESNVCVGKLRANAENDKFTLYDNGENYSKLSSFQMSQLRTEHGYFMYRYEPCNVGNIRKMVIVFPSVEPEANQMNEDIMNQYSSVKDQPETMYTFAQKYPKMKFESCVWRPVKTMDTMMNVFLRDGSRNKKLKVYVDNPPQWNPKTNTYVYDFKGRVTQPSIKNFQLIPEADGRRGDTLTDFVLQFGKNGKDSFILDVQYPLSIFQAFGLALSAFDTD